MARFFVGCRVRIVRALHHPQMVGVEARIVRWVDDERSLTGTYCGWLLDVPNPNGGRAVAHEFQIEPITPPHVAGSWEEVEQLLPNIREGVAA